jgi:Flp pilus assembly CpaF family ATPase
VVQDAKEFIMPENKPRPNRTLQRKARALAVREGIPYTLALARLQGLMQSQGVHLHLLLAKWMKDTSVGNIYFNSFEEGCFTKDGKRYAIQEPVFSSEEHLLACLKETLEDRAVLDHQRPVLDIVLDDGSRLNVSIPPLAQSTGFIIRKKVHFDYVQAVEQMVPSQFREDIRRWVCEGRSIVLSGATSSGKTTLLNYILTELAQPTKIIICEPSGMELQNLSDKHLVHRIDTVEEILALPQEESLLVLEETRAEKQIRLLAQWPGSYLTTTHGSDVDMTKLRWQRENVRLPVIIQVQGIPSRNGVPKQYRVVDVFAD